MAAPLAICLTPDANFFRPAVLTAASILRSRMRMRSRS